MDIADKVWRRRKRVNLTPLKRIVILMAINDEFLLSITPLFQDTSFFPNTPYLLTVAKWIIKHGKEYGRAPREYLDTKFNDYQAEIGSDEPDVELIAKFLKQLNDEYHRGDFNDVNVKYELEVAEELLQSYALMKNSNDVIEAIKANAIKEAIEIRKTFTLPAIKIIERPPSEIIEKKAITSTDLIKADISEPSPIITPWLHDGSITMIYGKRGVGKTWISSIIAVCVTRDNNVDVPKIGNWNVKRQAGVLYIDGEMDEYHSQKRLRLLTGRRMRDEHPGNRLTILSSSRIATDYRQQIKISDKLWREAIYDYLAADDSYQLIILDNIASLTPGVDENDKSSWDPINEWMLSLRHLGVAVIFIHHAGKGGGQRGTSGREDNVDNIIKLGKGYAEGNYDSSAIFIDINFEKARNVESSKISPFGLKIFENRRLRGFDWEIYDIKKDD